MSPKSGGGHAAHDTTVRKGTRQHTPAAVKKQKAQAEKTAERHRHYKAKARRTHLKKHRDPIAYGHEHVPVSPILSLTFTEIDRLKIVAFTAISGDRREGVAEKFGHSSQAYLFAHQNDPGFNPANPPGTSPHEYRNGGPSPVQPSFVGTPAYPRMAAGAELSPHQLGIDLASNAQASAFCHEVEKVGLHFFQPYDTASELHHIQCRMTAETLIEWLVKHGVIR